MSTQIQYRRGTSTQNDSFVGALAEITVDTTNKILRVHDGATAGGFATVGLSTSQTLSNKTLTAPVLSGNVTGTANISITGDATITGNLTVTGNATLSGNIVGDRIQNGTTSFDIQTANGNATISVAGTSNVVVFTSTGANITGTFNATGNANVGNIGATNAVFTNISGTLTTASQTNITSVGTLGSLSVTGNISGGNLSGTSIVGTLTTASQTNITSVGTLGSLNVTGNISGANLNITGGIFDTGALDLTSGSNGNITLSPDGSGVIVANKDIRNGQANGVGNIGTVGGFFNTVFAKSTSAQYADLAENYLADSNYPIGTVLIIGGDAEVTQSTTPYSSAIAGTVSENPATIMNAGLKGKNVTKVALVGRVPCRVKGNIIKGDLLTSSEIPGVAKAIELLNYVPGCVIGKALQNYNNDQEGVIEILVGRL